MHTQHRCQTIYIRMRRLQTRWLEKQRNVIELYQDLTGEHISPECHGTTENTGLIIYK